VLETRPEPLRDAGLSRSKLKAIRDLASRLSSGDLALDDLAHQPDEEVLRRLTTVWGIGTWTARMYLMFRLHRPNVWPVGDLGVRQGFARAQGLEAVPSAAELESMGDAYRPWRSVLAFYCWRILETELP
ncbi:MAG: hypothetical protein R3304_10800, partial [Longimicrobiales bacterium]|nr:hypothetical protein [Longimicrobiales bacterium]